MAQRSVRLIRHPLAVGGYLAQLSLNAPRTINALTLEMVETLLMHLRKLAADPEAAAVWIDGVGERGFCAGGDVRAMRESALAAQGGRAVEAEQFFETEYRVDYLIHRFPKPVLCWANGIVMGGGMGLLMGASHRIATPSSHFAMPEIAIGLYPDVGASWFLQRMPGRSGVFCALTGASLNSADALYAGLADYLLPDVAKKSVLRRLCAFDWEFDAGKDAENLTELLTDIEAEADVCLPASHLKQRSDLIERLCESLDPMAIDEAFAGLHGDDAWLNQAGGNFQRGAASTARIVLEQLRRAERLSLADAFRMEMVVSANRVCDPEFIEGVRAQLVDKDRRPKWLYADLAEVPAKRIDKLFTPPWPDNPLADLA